MVKQVLVLGTAAALALAATGCGVFHAAIYAPYGPGGGPNMEYSPTGEWYSATGCGLSCGRGVAACYRPSRCGPTMACAQADCSDCGPYTDGHCGPLTLVFALFRHHCFWGAGCGGRYYGEWLSDPPDCADPCDFDNGTIPYESSVVPSEAAPCPECQGAAIVRRQGGPPVARTPPRGKAPATAPSTWRTAGYASRQGYTTHGSYASRPGYPARQVPQAARTQTAPTSYAY